MSRDGEATFKEQALVYVMDAADASYGVLKSCESPIEVRFGAAFIVYAALLEGRPVEEKYEAPGVLRPRIILQPQAKVRDYRVDFVIRYAGTPAAQCGIVVECDGHDFHEKTKEQAARDKARDRVLHTRFAKVLRFTGSELHRNPFGCAEEAFGALDGVYSDWGGGR